MNTTHDGRYLATLKRVWTFRFWLRRAFNRATPKATTAIPESTQSGKVINDLHFCRKSGGNPVCDFCFLFCKSNRARLLPIGMGDPLPAKRLLLEVLQAWLAEAAQALTLRGPAGAGADAEFRRRIGMAESSIAADVYGSQFKMVRSASSQTVAEMSSFSAWRGSIGCDHLAGIDNRYEATTVLSRNSGRGDWRFRTAIRRPRNSA